RLRADGVANLSPPPVVCASLEAAEPASAPAARVARRSLAVTSVGLRARVAPSWTAAWPSEAPARTLSTGVCPVWDDRRPAARRAVVGAAHRWLLARRDR